MAIERIEPMKVEYSIVIGLCRRDLGLDRPPTAAELSDWSLNGKGRECITLTPEQAQYMLDNPRTLFGSK